MEACLAVEREQQKVSQKLQTASSSVSTKLQNLIDNATTLRNRIIEGGIEELNKEDQQALKEYAEEVSKVVQSVSQEHKDIHAAISKCGRVVDKYFVQDINGVSTKGVFDNKSKMVLNRAICEHLLREGRMDVAETLINETGLSRHESFIAMFTEVHQIVQGLRNRDVEPALQWVELHREELSRHNSVLEFRLCQRKYLALLSLNRVTEAVEYAKTLSKFVPRHKKDVQRLMGCLLFVKKGLESSPYSDLLDPWHWSDVTDIFTKDACRMLGLSLESPLAVALTIGCSALPQLINLRSVMTQRQVVDVLAHRDELPCEIPLPWRNRYHSIFTCPILRQQTTDANPPVRLQCGHAISRDAMKRLVNHSGRLKCPYCPVEMAAKDVLPLKF